MTATADSTSTEQQPGPVLRPALRARALGLARAGAAPVACGLVLVVLLATWVLAGGGGAVSRVRIAVTQAAVPMPSFTARGAAGRNVPVYLTIRNYSGNAAVLLSASSPAAARVELAGGPGAATPLGRLVIPAHGTVSLSPFGQDLVLIHPRSLQAGTDVLLRLRFAVIGTISVTAGVTPPGTP